MLIASQKATATHVAGFHTWHKLGRFVKKGEKGILILAPIVRAKSQSVEQTETDESSTAVGFRAAAPAEEFATLAHEVAHELMHRDERRTSTSKRSRETEAEAVAFVVCQAIGLETGSAAQDYIQLYEGDAKLLSESLQHIQQTATRILNAIGADKTSAPPA